MLCIRTFAGPNCPTHGDASGSSHVTEEGSGAVPVDEESDGEASARPARQASLFEARLTSHMADEADNELKAVQWSDVDEEAGEEAEGFKPAMEVKIRSR